MWATKLTFTIILVSLECFHHLISFDLGLMSSILIFKKNSIYPTAIGKLVAKHVLIYLVDIDHSMKHCHSVN